MSTEQVRRFRLVTEADAQQLVRGATIELEADGQITPLARDTLRERRVTVIRAGAIDPWLPDDLAPIMPVTRVAIGADHGGVKLKAMLIPYLRRAGLAVTDHGTLGSDPVDYPDFAAAVARAVASREADAGIMIDGGSGSASAMAANKIRGIRAAACPNVPVARAAREEAGANVLTLGAMVLDAPAATAIVDAWLSTPMRDAREIRQLLKVRRIEAGF